MSRVLCSRCFYLFVAALSGLLAFWLTFAPQTRAATGINREINYQARLLDASGNAVADGNYQMKFSLYDAASAGNRLWTATGTLTTPTALTVVVQNGLFTLALGDTSANGGWQNVLDQTVNWNSNGLFLGVTIAADGEMTPRKQLLAVPQAFNAENLQGMYASSTASGGQNLFTVNQTANDAATGTRNALLIKSSGTSSVNDYLLSGQNDIGTTVLSINRQGNVTSSGYAAFSGTNTSTFAGSVSALGNVSSAAGIFNKSLTVANKAVCLSDGTNCTLKGDDRNWNYIAATNLVQNATATTPIVIGGTVTTTAPVFISLGGAAASSSRLILGQNKNLDVSIGNATSSGLSSMFQFSGNSLFDQGNIGSATSVYIGGTYVIGLDTMQYGDGFISKNNGNLVLSASGGVITPSSDRGVALGNASLRYDAYLGNVTSTNVTSTNAFFTNFFATNATATNSFVTNVLNANVTSTNDFVTSFLGTNATTTNLFLTNLLGISVTTTNGYFTSLGSSQFVTTNATDTSHFVTNFLGTNVTTTNFYATQGTIANMTLTSNSWTNATGTNTTSTNLYGTTLGASNLVMTNTTSTNFSSLGDLNALYKGAANNIVDIGNASLFNGAGLTMAAQGKYVFAAVGGSSAALEAIDVSNPAAPSQAKVWTSGCAGSTPLHPTVRGRYIYYALDPYLCIEDISNPLNPSFVSQTNVGAGASGLAVSGKYAYVGTSGSLSVVDISNAASPTIVRSVASANADALYNVALQGKYAYSISKFGLMEVFDISNPVKTVKVGSYNGTVGTSKGIAVRGKYAYIGAGPSANVIQVLNVNDPTAPSTVATVAVTAPGEITLYGRYLFVASNSANITIVDVIDPTAPVVITTFAASLTQPTQALVLGRYAFVNTNDIPGHIHAFDLSGIEVGGFVAHSAVVGALTVEQDVNANGNINAGSGLNVGPSGIFSDGSLSVYSTNTTSTFSGPISLSAGSNQPGLTVKNSNATSTGTTWGAYIDKLLVGGDGSATGTANFSEIIQYTSGTNAGLCVDNASTGFTCLKPFAASIVTEDAVIANAFDLAEMYAPQGTVMPADLLTYGDAPASVKTSAGIAYDPHIIGVASTRPGFVLGDRAGVAVALTGRVPVKISPQNGPVAIGDPLTSAPYPGYAMKATKPGMILGFALDAAAATGTVEVFIKTSYYAANVLNTDGSVAEITDQLVVAPQATASAARPAVDSWGLTFRGSAWNGTSAVVNDFTLIDQVQSATSSRLSILGTASTTLFSIDQNGSAVVSGDVQVAGHLYPSARGQSQKDKYIFLDNSQGPTSTYMATNANGWQSSDAYDFAERYYSPEPLTPGDLVMVSQRGQLHVQRSLDEKQLLMGIVSTRPGFVAGQPATSTYPVALAGRVPTKVSIMKGAIHAGDPLGPSTIPGVAVKATAAGPIVGQALEDYGGDDVGLIEAFVNPGWWGGPTTIAAPTSTPAIVSVSASPVAATANVQSQAGFALIVQGARKVHVSYPTLQAYPNVQVTPRGEIDGNWWSDNDSDTGFDIFLKQDQPRDVTFAWRVEATQNGQQLYNSDGTYVRVNPTTGLPITPTRTTTTAATPIGPVVTLFDPASLINRQPVVPTSSAIAAVTLPAMVPSTMTSLAPQLTVSTTTQTAPPVLLPTVTFTSTTPIISPVTITNSTSGAATAPTASVFPVLTLTATGTR